MLPGAIDTFAGAQGAGRKVAENVEKEIVCEASHCVPLVGGPPPFQRACDKDPFLII
jgi:ABC-type thiamine transport system substrate-binding protein